MGHTWIIIHGWSPSPLPTAWPGGFYLGPAYGGPAWLLSEGVGAVAGCHELDSSLRGQQQPGVAWGSDKLPGAGRALTWLISLGHVAQASGLCCATPPARSPHE